MSVDVPALDRVALADELEWGLTSINIPLNQVVVKLLLDHLCLLHKWNRVHNLTAIRDPKKLISTHLLDSLSVLPHIPPGRVLDVGTGAGLPGIPLAVANPDLDVTLIESNHKKAAFLRQAVGELKLPNAAVICKNVEEWQPATDFQCIIARAYAEICQLIESSKHLLSDNGIFAAMKGRMPDAEIRDIPQGFAVKKIIELIVPGLGAERHLILIGRA